MKVFISWSGTGSKSHVLAKAFHDWLPNVFQTVETFMSSDTLVAGDRWQNSLSKALQVCDFGIACLTPKSLHADWILFECGALAKKVDLGRVVPVRCGVTEEQMSRHPLTMFGYVNLDVDGVRKLCESINASLAEQQLPKDRFDLAFQMWWPAFEAHIKKVEATDDNEPVRKPFSMEESMEETLSILHSLSRRLSPQLPSWSNALGQGEPSLGALLRGATDTGALQTQAQVRQWLGIPDTDTGSQPQHGLSAARLTRPFAPNVKPTPTPTVRPTPTPSLRPTPTPSPPSHEAPPDKDT